MFSHKIHWLEYSRAKGDYVKRSIKTTSGFVKVHLAVLGRNPLIKDIKVVKILADKETGG